jgi:hypothetical protein
MTAFQQIIEAADAAEYWLTAERQLPGETTPDEILRVLRAALARVRSQEAAQ